MHVVEIDLSSPSQMKGVLVPTLTFTGRLSLLIVEVDIDPGLAAGETLARPKLY
jgi:hypothetical protein